MAQPLIYDFVAELAGRVALPEPIVEFGSMQVEAGQPNDLRRLFAGRDFTGTDMRPGPGVDRVEDLRALTYPDASVGTALCLDTLEHCADPLGAVREIHRVLAPGGVCVLSSVMFFPVHGYPQDYWRFTPEGMRLVLEPFPQRWSRGVGHPELPMQVVGVGLKQRPLAELDLDGMHTLADAQAEWDRAEGKVRVGLLHVPLRELARTLAGELPRAVAQRAAARLRSRP
ncbi:MAG TPA: class I SAM-dependent methyltransferase [Solirubrobacteraceae bacterium]|nr:class I SAM-dependent methyltransferase [Solirubrobacteraceae bacterium]